jgi:type II secretory pathway component PulF
MSDVIWICRRVAEAMREGASIGPALEAATRDAPPGPLPLITALQQTVSAGGRMSEELRNRHAPGWVACTVQSGEASARLERTLIILADRLELETQILPTHNPRLREHALAFGRIGMMLSVGVPVVQAIELAAESVAPSPATDALKAARQSVVRGGYVSDALATVALELPPMTAQMIRDGEDAGNLDQALSVVADYLLDEAQTVKSRQREVRK